MESSHPLSLASQGAVADDKLRHLPDAARAAYDRFQKDRDPLDLDIVTIAIVQDFSPGGANRAIAAYPRDTTLIEGLGFDSLAITEIVFYAEDIFQITISNEEIIQVRTIDDLLEFVRGKVTAKPLA
jgi:acyl carrier protein